MTALTKFVDSKTETKYKMLRQKKKRTKCKFFKFFHIMSQIQYF